MTTYKYEQQIIDAYTRIGFKPQGDQLKFINEIVTAYLDEGYTNLVLSAPTGTGKSMIGVVVSEVVHSILNPGESANASFMLTATNVLSEQYESSFADGNDGRFLMIKGANNYECSALSKGYDVQYADVCAKNIFKSAGMEDVINSNCNRCEYSLTRQRRPFSRHLITNYSYYFVDRMYSPAPMAARSVCVFDEAHLLNDLFTEHNAIYLTEKKMQATIDEVAEHLKLGNTDIFKDFKMIRDGLLQGLITEENVKTFLRVLGKCYAQVVEACTQEAQRNIRNQNAYTKFSRMSKKYQGLVSKVEDYLLFEYPAVFEYRPKDVAKGQNEHEVSVKPIFIGEMFEVLHNAKHNLLMSATITEEYVNQTMVLPGKTKYMRLSPQFPRENKKIVFFKPQLLNYTTMKNPETIKQLCATTWQIVDYHAKRGERGIILAPSFVVAESVAGSIRNMGSDVKVFEHKRGEKLADILDAFKGYPINKPAVMVTPSGYEGVDLPGELSRYQILLKHPFASLGDKRIKTILDQYPYVYGWVALSKIVQGAGRSVRGHEDWATTYCLDTATKRAWSDKGMNVWNDEFQTSFTSQLGLDD